MAIESPQQKISAVSQEERNIFLIERNYYSKYSKFLNLKVLSLLFIGICIIAAIFYYQIALFVVLFSTLNLICFIVSSTQKEIENFWFNIFLPIKFLHPFLLFRLQQKNSIKVRQLLKDHAFYLIPHLKIHDMEYLLRLIFKNSKYFTSFSPEGQRLIKNYVKNQFNLSSLSQFQDLYFFSLSDLIQQLVNDEHLIESHIERICFEITPDQYKYLENNLPSNHPVIQKILQLHKMSISDDFAILK